MKISILSDFHLGYSYTPETEKDSFENAEEAIEKALDSDLILLAGDIFDTRVPRTRVWANAMKILAKPILRRSSGVKLVSCSKELKKISKRTLEHLPLIAIHGTHERRGRGEINPIEALENAGLLIHLHCNTIVFEKDGIKVAIHGMSGVPERYAKDVLKKWDPKPIEGCFNILLLHQSIHPYVYSPLEPPSLSVSNLPKGFDIIVNGHIHTPTQEKIGNTILLIPGSTIVTQYEKSEALSKKGFFEVIFNEGIKVNFRKLEKTRKFFYEELKIENKTSVREQAESLIKDILKEKFEKKPIVKIKIIGKETEVLDQELRDIEKKLSDRAIIVFSKELESPEIAKKIELLRNLREQKLSIEEIGLKLLEKNLKELGFSSSFGSEKIFKLLSEGEIEKVFNLLVGKQKTLEKELKKSLEGGLSKWMKKD